MPVLSRSGEVFESPTPNKPEPKKLISREACPEPVLNGVKELAEGTQSRKEKNSWLLALASSLIRNPAG